MSDFLNKFTRDKYAEMVKQEEREKEEGVVKEEPVKTARIPEEAVDPDYVLPAEPAPPVEEEVSEPLATPAEEPEALKETAATEPVPSPKEAEKAPAGPPTPPEEKPKKRITPPPVAPSRHSEEETVIDPSYRAKRRNKIIALAAVGLILLLLLAFGIYRFTHVRMPNFIGRTISDARVWGAQNRVEFLLEQTYSNEHDVNTVISQGGTQGDMVRKGSTVPLQSSLGPDPEEVLPMPEFQTFSAEQARAWKEENKANNFSVINQYSDTVEAGRFVSLSISDRNVTPESYRRKDTAIAYFSRGPEVFEKNINVPVFTGKTRAEAEAWANTNGLKLTVEEVTSSTVEPGFVVSQSVPAAEKVARNDPFKISVSVGKATVVPNFGHYNMANAGEVTSVNVQMLTRYSDTAPYGQLISQSIAAGTQLTDKDDKTVTVIYSLGLPYLRDLRDTTNEGELQKLFFDEFQSKGADVTYTVNYVRSPVPKGTVIHQSTYESLIPLSFHVRLTVSRGDGSSYDPSVDAPISGDTEK